jgi:cell division septal protein FtsQ
MPLMSSAKLVSGVLVLLLGLLLYYFFVSHEFYVYDVQVVGAQHLGLQQVLDTSEVQEMSVFYVKPAEVESRLRELRWVREAEVRCGFPGRVRITLRERQVAFAWRQAGTVQAVDDEGVLLPLSEVPEDVLRVDDFRSPKDGPGGSGREVLDQELIASVLAARTALSGVNRLGYGPAHGLTFQSQRGYEVRLGQGQVDHKVAIWRALEDELVARGIQPAHVDVRFPSMPSYGLPESLGAAWVTARGTT